MYQQLAKLQDHLWPNLCL